ncbi:MAG: hypothetical protein E7262_03905 [Lachnospiraceae bacterium]|nr:hypothetical protein [Lachnospiraceae bacterium]
MRNYKKEEKVSLITTGIIIILTIVIGITSGLDEVDWDKIDKSEKSVAVSNTGNERADTIAQAQSQLGVTEDDNAEYGTIYNKWFWNFVNIDGNDTLGWSSIPHLVKHGAWCYMFLGWSADKAGCQLTVKPENKGVFVCGRNARAFEAYNEYNTSERYPNWFTVNNRKRNISTTTDVVTYGEPGDFVFLKSGGGYNHVYLIAGNNGSTVSTIEGNSSNKVVARTVSKDGLTKWNGMNMICICKPMYRATATFKTNGGTINSMPSGWSNGTSGGSGADKYYKYKFYDDLETYNGTQIQLPSGSQVTKDGATFQGWYTNSSFSGGAVTKTNAKQRGNITYYAKFSDITYSVQLVTNGGTLAPGADITTYKSGNTTYLPDSSQISKHGYTFAGWYEDFWFNSVRKYSISSSETGNKIYYAKWEPNTYGVTLYPNGGTIDPYANITRYTYGVGANLPSAAQISRTGYDFQGWYANSSFTGATYTKIGLTETGNKVFYALWKPKVYTVTLHPNGGRINTADVLTRYTYSIGATLPNGSEVTKAGCEFEGWYDNPSLSGSKHGAISPTDIGNKEYWAKWITFDLGLDADMTYVYGSVKDPSIYKADKIGFKITTDSDSDMVYFFTSGRSVSSSRYSEPAEILPNRHYDLPVPDGPASTIARQKDDLVMYLNVRTKCEGFDGEEYYTYYVYNQTDVRLRYVATFDER